MKRLFAVSLILLLTLTLVSPVIAQDEGPVTGSFSTTAAPSINSLQIFTDAALTTPATSLTPMQYYWIKASITDNDGIGNLSNVLIGLSYDVDGGAMAFADRPALNVGTSSEWDFWQIEDSWVNAVYPDSTTWFNVTDAATQVFMPSNAQNIDPTYTTHDFVMRVRIGKVAKETETAGSTWQIIAKVNDKQIHTAELQYQNAGAYGLPMNWYGEVIVPANYTVNWGAVEAGMATSNAKSALPIVGGVTYISNGTNFHAIKAATSWSNGAGQTVTLKELYPPTAANTFTLMAGTAGAILDDAGLFVNNIKDANIGDTTEAGVVNQENIWLALSPNVTAGGTFTGAITYGIHNN